MQALTKCPIQKAEPRLAWLRDQRELSTVGQDLSTDMSVQVPSHPPHNTNILSVNKK